MASLFVATLAQPIRRWQYTDELRRLSPCFHEKNCSAANLSFLHFPKCGTSMEVTLRLFGSGVNPLDNHRSHAENASDEEVRHVVAMFRPPEDRLASTYSWIQGPRLPARGVD